MAIDFESKTKDQLDALLANYRNASRTRDPVFLEILRVREAKFGNGLDFEKSLQVVAAAARDRRFVSYKNVADASGAEWSKVHWEMSGHLQRMLEYTWAKGLPPLSAIVVNADLVDTGAMNSSAIGGFMRGAEAVGYDVGGDAATVLCRFQDQVFAWAGGEIAR